jgi:16S rRNA (guanine527-N7)-methyltransferase
MRQMNETVDQRLTELLARYPTASDCRPALIKLLDVLAQPRAPTTVHEPERGVDIHIADSLVGLEVPELRAACLIADLGAGAGLPGLVLAAALADTRVMLVEAVARKCEFLRSAVEAMQLANAEVVWARAEEWADGIGRCDAVTARALAAMPVLCEYAAPLLRDGGVLVAWKGAVPEAEAADERAAAEHLGLRAEPVRAVVPYAGSERRTLRVLRKVAPTPPSYPRRPGIATKRPLSATNLR